MTEQELEKWYTKILFPPPPKDAKISFLTTRISQDDANKILEAHMDLKHDHLNELMEDNCDG